MFTKYSILVALFLLSFGSFAQSDQTEEVEGQLEYLDDSSNTGYTILLYNGTDARIADDFLRKYNSTYSKERLSNFESCPPTYRTTIGEFHNHLEGFRYLNKIKSEFPDALLVPASSCN